MGDENLLALSMQLKKVKEDNKPIVFLDWLEKMIFRDNQHHLPFAPGGIQLCVIR
jgi:hypothetical protein